MFANLISSAQTRRSALSPATWGVSTVTHVLFMLAVVGMASRAADAPSAPGDRGSVTWVNVAEPEGPPPVEIKPSESRPKPTPEPPPLPPEPADFTEPAPRDVTRPDQLAGFQELVLPGERTGIPDPLPAAAVNATDFLGRGVAGGVAGGRRMLPSGAARDTVQREAAPPEPPLPSVVDVPPRVVNGGAMLARMREFYPPDLRAADIEGEVLVQFVVNTEGRPEMDGLLIVSSTHMAFEGPTRELVRGLRLEPARRNGRAVRAAIRLPVMWSISK